MTPLDKGRALTELLDLIVEDPPNALRIRALCREYPGLIASAGLRLKIWSILLLGNDLKEDCQQDVLDPKEPCAEQHVLEADVHRTRADVAEYRSTEWREYIRIILQKFCLDHGIQYKQGMNEVLAPFLSLNPPPGGQLLTYALLRAFLFRYLERLFCVDDSSYLFKAFRLFHLLLLYFDPALALHLGEGGALPELYAPPWFLTLFARSLPLPQVLRLWDMILAVDDAAFVFFVGVALLRGEREALLRGDGDSLPEVIATLHISSEEDVDEVSRQAWQLYKACPRSVLRGLRLCCVASPLLSSPLSPLSPSVSLDVQDLDHALEVQATRSCLYITPQELVEALLPPPPPAAPRSPSLSPALSSPNPLPPHQYVVLDVRSVDEALYSGGGTLPRAIQLEPRFLASPSAFGVWVQHFDPTRGCPLCLLDLPPPSWSGLALWRRLLLGEGDGQGGFEGRAESERRLEALLGGKRTLIPLDPSHPVEREELSPAIILAQALQRHSFPSVTVLEGGFPALVRYLQQSKGGVEPVVLNHQQEKWEAFLKSTGRYVEHAQRVRIKREDQGERALSPLPRKPGDLSERERTEIALRMAERLQHEAMATLLRERLGRLVEGPEG